MRGHKQVHIVLGVHAAMGGASRKRSRRVQTHAKRRGQVGPGADG